MAGTRRVSWTTIAVTAILALAASMALSLAHPIELRVDGQRVISDVAPVSTSKNHVFVPLRPVDDALGAETRYERETGKIAVVRGDQTLQLRVGDNHAKLNGMPMTLKRAPFRVRGRVMLGANALERAFGVRVKYDRHVARVDLQSPGIVDANVQTH